MSNDPRTPEGWRTAGELYSRALELPPEEREAFVRRAAGDDHELASEVLRLLARSPESRFLASPVTRIELPHRLADFELLEELGRGGMGVVYRARQVGLERTVAVKVLPHSLTITQRQVDRFQREARAIARLDHPHIVSVLTVGQEGETRFFAMELVPGGNLAEELERLRARDEDSGARARLPSSQAEGYLRAVAELVRQVADGLSHAHEHGVVHRDVKPSNLLLDGHGQVRIVDFGLARDEEQGSLTRSGELAGTPHYMSPEQARASRRGVDHRTDVYSLGVVLYELLTLRRPFEGRTSQEVLHNILLREAPRVRALNPRVPRDLETICQRAMAKEPERRYTSASELRDDLARFLAGEAIRARPPALGERARHWARRHRVPLGATGVALAATALGALARDAYARDVHRDELLAQVARGRAAGPLASAPLGHALELRRALAELREGGALPPATQVELDALAHDFDELRAQLCTDGERDLAFAHDVAQAEGVREFRRLTGLQKLLFASQLFPEDDELRRLAALESTYPSLTVRALDETGNATGAEVFLREIDVFTSAIGAARSLGRAPVEALPVLPGYYRVVVAFDTGGIRELVCAPGPAVMAIELSAQHRADEAALTAGMIAFPAEEYVVPEFGGPPGLQGKSVHLDAFLVDRCEVSNAEYAAFLAATGHPEPPYWSRLGDHAAFLAEYGERPVISVTWLDAVAYANWSGKRLLTLAEWLRVCSGVEGRPFPYSSDPAAAPRGNVLQPSEFPTTPELEWAAYLERTVPVDSMPEAATPEGVLHLFGNVREPTESMAISPEGGSTMPIPRLYDRFYLGCAWDAVANGFGPWTVSYNGIGAHYDDWFTGIRCARSAQP